MAHSRVAPPPYRHLRCSSVAADQRKVGIGSLSRWPYGQGGWAVRAQPGPEWLSVEAPDWARIRLHRGEPTTAHLTVIEPAGAHHRLDRDTLRGARRSRSHSDRHECTRSHRGRSPHRLWLRGGRAPRPLGRPLTRLPRVTNSASAPQRVRDRSAVLELDAQAFPGTALDDAALTDALRATTTGPLPHHRSCRRPPRLRDHRRGRLPRLRPAARRSPRRASPGNRKCPPHRRSTLGAAARRPYRRRQHAHR